MARTRMRWHGPLAKAEVRDATRRGLRDAADYVLDKSQRRVPIDPDRRLQESGRTDMHPSRLRAAVSYDTPYAVIQHEKLDWHHDPGRKAKYLQHSLFMASLTVTRIVAAELRRVLDE